MSDPSSIDRLLAIMARLRDPRGGCPWDREQDFATIAPYTIEESYEGADAIARGDMASLKDELGDLLFQVVFHARMAEERGDFAFGDVVGAISDKMLRRHPHVFGAVEVADAAAQTVAWEAHKAVERAGQGTLDGVALALPALLLAGAYGSLVVGVAFLGWFAALVTGRMPEGLRNAGAQALRYTSQANGYVFLLTGAYPYSGPCLPPPPAPAAIPEVFAPPPDAA